MPLRFLLPAVLTLLIQRLLGMPGLPSWSTEVILPMVWIVAAALLRKEPGWPYEALILGLAWDLLLEPVVGPGGIAWSASCLALYALAGVVADRSPRAWAGFGLVGTAVLTLVHQAALIPLGLPLSLTLGHWVRSLLFTSIWCGLVGFTLAVDLPSRWRAYRSRRLR